MAVSDSGAAPPPRIQDHPSAVVLPDAVLDATWREHRQEVDLGPCRAIAQPAGEPGRPPQCGLPKESSMGLQVAPACTAGCNRPSAGHDAQSAAQTPEVHVSHMEVCQPATSYSLPMRGSASYSASPSRPMPPAKELPYTAPTKHKGGWFSLMACFGCVPKASNADAEGGGILSKAPQLASQSPADMDTHRCEVPFSRKTTLVDSSIGGSEEPAAWGAVACSQPLTQGPDQRLRCSSSITREAAGPPAPAALSIPAMPSTFRPTLAGLQDPEEQDSVVLRSLDAGMLTCQAASFAAASREQEDVSELAHQEHSPSSHGQSQPHYDISRTAALATLMAIPTVSELEELPFEDVLGTLQHCLLPAHMQPSQSIRFTISSAGGPFHVIAAADAIDSLPSQQHVPLDDNTRARRQPLGVSAALSSVEAGARLCQDEQRGQSPVPPDRAALRSRPLTPCSPTTSRGAVSCGSSSVGKGRPMVWRPGGASQTASPKQAASLPRTPVAALGLSPRASSGSSLQRTAATAAGTCSPSSAGGTASLKRLGRSTLPKQRRPFQGPVSRGQGAHVLPRTSRAQPAAAGAPLDGRPCTPSSNADRPDAFLFSPERLSKRHDPRAQTPSADIESSPTVVVSPADFHHQHCQLAGEWGGQNAGSSAFDASADAQTQSPITASCSVVAGVPLEAETPLHRCSPCSVQPLQTASSPASHTKQRRLSDNGVRTVCHTVSHGEDEAVMLEYSAVLECNRLSIAGQAPPLELHTQCCMPVSYLASKHSKAPQMQQSNMEPSIRSGVNGQMGRSGSRPHTPSRSSSASCSRVLMVSFQSSWDLQQHMLGML